MKRIFSVLAVAALMAAAVVAMSMPAFADPFHLNPSASPYDGPGANGMCVDTYTGPSDPPPENASGGNPGYTYNQPVGAGC